jgi:hypothetical protein
MFCARCGEQIPDASQICPLCGREATLNVPPPPPLPAAAPAVAPAHIQWPDEPRQIGPPMRRPDLKGVGGWLLFFCIARTVLSPLLTAIALADRGFNMIDLAFTGFGVFVGIMVWTVNASAFVLLWIYFALSAALLLLAIAAVALSGAPNPQILGRLFFALIFTILWFFYFQKSDRVQATFGKNL